MPTPLQYFYPPEYPKEGEVWLTRRGSKRRVIEVRQSAIGTTVVWARVSSQYHREHTGIKKWLKDAIRLPSGGE